MVLEIPVVETERLLLRGWREADFEHYASFMADPEVTRYLGPGALSRVDAWRNMATVAGHWLLRGYGFWAVERKKDGAFIGRVGLWYPEGWPGLEVGWTLGRAFWGQGYATEAGRASLDYAFRTQTVPKMLSVIHVENRPSQRVAARLGETRGPRHEITVAGRTYPVEAWEITRERWAELRGQKA